MSSSSSDEDIFVLGLIKDSEAVFAEPIENEQSENSTLKNLVGTGGFLEQYCWSEKNSKISYEGSVDRQILIVRQGMVDR